DLYFAEGRLSNGPLRKAQRAESRPESAEDFALAERDRQAHPQPTSSRQAGDHRRAARDQKSGAAQFEETIAGRTRTRLLDRIHWIKGILIQEILPAREGFRSWSCRKKAGLELLGCPDFCAAEKRRVLVHDESRRFDVTAQGATSLKFAAFGRENIS